jgi:hypothetical protein
VGEEEGGVGGLLFEEPDDGALGVLKHVAGGEERRAGVAARRCDGDDLGGGGGGGGFGCGDLKVFFHGGKVLNGGEDGELDALCRL